MTKYTKLTHLLILYNFFSLLFYPLSQLPILRKNLQFYKNYLLIYPEIDFHN